MEKWMICAKRADFNLIAEKHGISPVTARLIINRDVPEEMIGQYLFGDLSSLYDPSLLSDAEKACQIAAEKIKSHKKIRIIGDYDIDGIMSSYILLNALSSIGADADARLPDRISDGYGLSENLVKEAHKDGVDTIITCDNGIAASSQIALAKELGMTVIVTDHHEVPFDADTGSQILPPADAVIDPKKSGCPYPYKEICGAVVALKFAALLYRFMGFNDDIIYKYIEYAAIATIGDVCPLTDENRIIVKEGLKKLPETNNLGLISLIEMTELDINSISSYHIGFVIGPCLNASGRLDTAEKALSLLMSDNKTLAIEAAWELVELNKERKMMTEEGITEAVNIIETTSAKDDKVLVVYLPDCHESLAGIIAGRLKEQYNRPSFVLTASSEGIKGSGRSIEAFNMYENLSKCGHLFSKFGGHALAAGLSMPEENLPEFRRIINADSRLTDEDLIPRVLIDIQLPLKYISDSLINEFEMLRPFGQANRKPLFAQKELKILSPSIVGKNKNAVRMRVSDKDGCTLDGIYFGDAEKFINYISEKPTVSLAYYPTINTFRGVSSIQLNIQNYF